MELAIRELPKGPEKSKYENRLTSYRADRAQLEKELVGNYSLALLALKNFSRAFSEKSIIKIFE